MKRIIYKGLIGLVGFVFGAIVGVALSYLLYNKIADQIVINVILFGFSGALLTVFVNHINELK
mgnify:CR=1 FL=1|jgi:ABC-type uncharacterized transport system permease subunit